MAEPAAPPMPEPESDDLGRYLEDTITIDWQTPAVMECARGLLEGAGTSEDRVRRLHGFVRDEIAHALDVEPEPGARASCRASEVLSSGSGLGHAKSHLLAALLRYAGVPTGFCYARIASDDVPGRRVLHGFNAAWWSAGERWIFLDAGGRRGGPRGECRFEPPWTLACRPDPERGEDFLPFVYRRPGKRVIDLLERAPDLATVLRNLPEDL